MDTIRQTLGLRHVALNVKDPQRTAAFYVQAFGMQIEWQPDPQNVYLTTAGLDTLAIHQADVTDAAEQHLAHIGFCLAERAEVDAWHARLVALGVPIVAPPKDHRDGARSVYVRDPDGVVVQVIYHPPVAERARRKG